eukprot:gene13427-14807_t
MAAAWKNFKQQMKEKRTGSKGNTNNIMQEILKKEEIVVQRLSSEVSGKAQKYSRIGPREFVPFEHQEVSLNNIKRACTNHFVSRLGVREQFCDVLAAEQGPSCRSLEQVPDLKLLYVRFVSSVVGDAHDGAENSASPLLEPAFKRPKILARTSLPITGKGENSERKDIVIPKSLTVLDMLKLGKVVVSSTEVIELHSFDMATLAWSRQPINADFKIDKEPFGTGGFRSAFKAYSTSQNLGATEWVVKKYLQCAVDVINATKQSLEQHTRKVVQMHTLAKNFAHKLEMQLGKDRKLDEYGDTLKYRKLYMGRYNGEFVTVEEFIEGIFYKHINNNGNISAHDSEYRLKSERRTSSQSARKSGSRKAIDVFNTPEWAATSARSSSLTSIAKK